MKFLKNSILIACLKLDYYAVYQGAKAEAEAKREVHSRCLGVQRVIREVSILFIEFRECQPRFQVFANNLVKTLKTEFLEGIF